MKYSFSIKKYVVRTGLAILLIAGGLSAPALALSPTSTSGNVGYNAGFQRHAKFNVEKDSNNCSTRWNVDGNYNIAFNLQGDPTKYTHEVTLDQTGNSISGTGGYPVGGPHTYEWEITSGTVTGSTITLTAKYTLGADALTPLTTMTMTGTIASNGTMSGTWSDNYQGGSRTGQWATTSGNATQKIVGCRAEGNFKYTDVNGSNYKVDVRFAKFSGNDAWFAGPVKSGNVGAGQWLFAKVHDGGTPGTNGDQISGSFATKNDAKLGVALMTNPSDGPFAISSGNLKVQ